MRGVGSVSPGCSDSGTDPEISTGGAPRASIHRGVNGAERAVLESSWVKIDSESHKHDMEVSGSIQRPTKEFVREPADGLQGWRHVPA